jgi:hypothetical protein
VAMSAEDFAAVRRSCALWAGSDESTRRTHDGFWLAFAVIALTAAIIPFGYWAALGLLCLLVLAPALGQRGSK